MNTGQSNNKSELHFKLLHKEEGTPSKADIQQDLSTVYKTNRKQLLLQTISKSKKYKEKRESCAKSLYGTFAHLEINNAKSD